MINKIKVDTEIKVLGFQILTQYLGLVESARFITLIQRENFDYTQWQQTLFSGLNGEEISHQAMDFHREQSGQPNSAALV